MRKFLFSLLLVLLVSVSLPALAQGKRKRPPKSDNVQTQTDAAAKEKSAREAKEAEYKMRRDHQMDIQDKATKKRMKKNLKRAQKQSWGKNVPWYKRVFRKKNF